MILNDRSDHIEKTTQNGVRERALQSVRKVQTQDVENTSPEEVRQILQELLVYQAELEIQNEELRRAQLEADLARQRYFSLYDLAPVGYCTLDDKGIITEANLTLARMLGTDRARIIKQSVARFIHKEDFGQYYGLRKKLRKEGQSRSCELRMLRQDGAWFWARMEALVNRESDLETVRLVVSDISESKRMSDSIKESEEYFRASFEDHHAVKMHVDPRTGRIIRANKAAAAFYGWPQEDLERMHVQDISIDDAVDYFPELTSTRTRGKQVLVFKQRLRDGSVRHMEIFASRIIFKEREVLHCIAHDITEQIRAQRALVESESKYRALSEDMPLMLCQFTLDLRLNYVNSAYAAYFGKTPKQLLGTSFLDLIPEQEHQAARNVIAAMTPDSPTAVLEHQVFDKFGRIRWQRWTDRALLDAQGCIVGYQAIGEDITERKLAEDQLREKTAQLERANAEKDKLFTVIAHDLKSPIAMLLTSTELLANEIEIFSEEDIRRLATELNKSTKSALALLEDLLQWARMSQDGLDFTPSACSLNDLITTSLLSTQDLCRQKDITTTLNLQADLQVFVDRPMINTVIRNIVFNAVKFTPRGGSIDISALQKGTFVKVAIRDTGIGMSEKILSDLFNFTKGKVQFGTEGEKGTGLGLVLCKEFIEKHGGYVWVESRPGQGTTVFFTLPGRAESLPGR